MTGQDSGYTLGEVAALLAPLLGCEPNDLLDWVIVGLSSDGPITTSSRPDDLRFTTMVLVGTAASILAEDDEPE